MESGHKLVLQAREEEREDIGMSAGKKMDMVDMADKRREVVQKLVG